MAYTPNIDLYVEDDATTKIQPWREKMNGTGSDSNMVKIDTAIGGKADKPAPVNVTLRANAWTGVDAPYYQTVAVDGLSATQVAEIHLANGATAEQREVAREAMMDVYAQADGSITIVADGEMPEVDLHATVILFG